MISLLWLLPLGACSDKAGLPATGDSATGQDTGGPGADLGGVVMVAGGGSEGDEGDATAWSARLYPHLWRAGDVTGDGLVRVAIIASEEQTEWLPEYFESLGVDEAFNLILDSEDAADAPSLEAMFEEVDAAFIKGGDQGEYYDLWNDRAIEVALRALVEERGGGIGGTSAGAMSQSQYALAGGADYISADALEDACTTYLDDTSDGGSGIHSDFLGFVGGVLIDTHFTERARLGRLAGALARAIDDGAPSDLIGVGLEARTGLVVQGGRAEVIGAGSVSFLRAGPDASLDRSCGSPLLWTGLRLDVLTEGWVFDLDRGEVDTDERPEGAVAAAWDGGVTENEEVEWEVAGDTRLDEERFEWVVGRDPRSYDTWPGTETPVLEDAIGVLDALDQDSRASASESMFRALVDHVGSTGFFVGAGSALLREATQPSEVHFAHDARSADPELASLVIDTAEVSWTSMAPEASAYDVGDGSLRAGGLVGLTLHVLADTDNTGLAYDSEAHDVVTIEP